MNLTLENIYSPIAKDLAGADSVYVGFLNSFPDPVGSVTKSLVGASRKQLRAGLVLLTARLGFPDESAMKNLACAAELLHSASLVHDDIIDESPMRRKQPALHVTWRNKVSILAGDLLYARAFGMISALDKPRVSEHFSNAAVDMCRGQIRELFKTGSFDLNEEEYLKILEAKTASLISACCAAGGILGGLSQSDAKRLSSFGINFGLGFQIADDCLDIQGNPKDMGKKQGTDATNGMLTLPLIYHLSQDGDGRRKRVEEIFKLSPQNRIQSLREEIKRSGALDYARERAVRFAKDAKNELSSIEGNEPLMERLADLTDFAITRKG